MLPLLLVITSTGRAPSRFGTRSARPASRPTTSRRCPRRSASSRSGSSTPSCCRPRDSQAARAHAEQPAARRRRANPAGRTRRRRGTAAGAREAGASQDRRRAASTRVVAAQLRRLIDVAHPRQQQESSEVRFGPLRLDPRRATASVGNSPVALTGGEFEVLLLLASQPGELVHRQAIARTLGRADGADTRRSADMHVCRIRRKLRDAGGASLQIETVRARLPAAAALGERRARRRPGRRVVRPRPAVARTARIACACIYTCRDGPRRPAEHARLRLRLRQPADGRAPSAASTTAISPMPASSRARWPSSGRSRTRRE